MALFLLTITCLLAIGPSTILCAFHDVPDASVESSTHRVRYQVISESEYLPLLPNAFVPYSSAVKNQLCRNHSIAYLNALRNTTLWAAKMFDSSAKLPTGFLFGSTHQLGNYEECVSVEALVGDSSRDRFLGKYCLATARIAPSDLPQRDKNEDIWSKIKESIDMPYENKLNEIHWAICMPSTCSNSDLEAHLKYILPHLTALKGIKIPIENLNVEVSPNACTSNEEYSTLTIGQIAMIILIAFLVINVICGTLFDHFERRRSRKFNRFFSRFILCFSVSKNVEKLSKDYKPDSPLKCLSGMKAMSMCLIIFGHRIFFSLGGAVNNADFIEKRYNRIETAILLGGLTVVDTFYLISGLLLCYCLMSESSKIKNVWLVPYLYIRRYIRLTPIYMFVVAFYATLFIKTGYGPVWNLKIGMERDRCLKNWWTNLLYINTVVNANEMCVIQSWYVTSDMHLFILSVPVVYLLAKRPTAGRVVLSLLFITSVVVPFSVTYYQQLEPLILGYMENLIDLAKYDTFRLSYIQTYMRGTPYFMGIALGYALHHIKKSQVKITKLWVNIIIIFSFVSGFLPILIASVFYQPGYQYSALTAGIYASLHRVSWGLGMCGCILVCAVEKEWFIMRCMTWNVFQPLSRLTYTAYLLHAAIQIYGVGSLQNPQHIGVFAILHQTLGDIFVTFIAAFIVSMLIEAPLLGIEKLIFKETKTQDTSPSIKQNHTKEDDNI